MLDQPTRKEAGKPRCESESASAGNCAAVQHHDPATAYMQFWNTSALQVGGEVAQSWLHFLSERWAKDLAFPQQIAACKTADDLCVAYSEFWQQAAKDYSAEFNEIADTTWTAVRRYLTLSKIAARTAKAATASARPRRFNLIGRVRIGEVR